jgi:hypothetical protein
MRLVDGRVWAGTRGGICAWNIEVNKFTFFFFFCFLVFFIKVVNSFGKGTKIHRGHQIDEINNEREGRRGFGDIVCELHHPPRPLRLVRCWRLYCED